MTYDPFTAIRVKRISPAAAIVIPVGIMIFALTRAVRTTLPSADATMIIRLMGTNATPAFTALKCKIVWM